MNKNLKVIACLKVLRGALAIAVGVILYIIFGYSEVLNWQEHSFISSIAQKDPFFQIFIDWLAKFPNEQALYISLFAFGIGLIRYIEAIGVWFDKTWAQWLVVITAFIYIPFEINELIHQFTWTITIIMAINFVVAFYLLHILRKKIKRI
jgi:hypothetical protein